MEFSTPEAVCRLCFSNATLYLFFELLVDIWYIQLRVNMKTEHETTI